MFPEKKHLKILLADDEPGILTTLTGILQAVGYPRVTGTHDGSEAKARLMAEDFDLLITDLEMPFLKGDELTKFALEKRPGIQVAVLSGVIDDFLARDLREMGARYCYRKPIRVKDLLEVLEGVFDQLIGDETLRLAEQAVLPLLEIYERVDRYAEGQSRRTAELSVETALAVGFSLRQAMQVRVAALGHDVGMAKVDLVILNKPGPLSESEFEAVKRHPIYSVEMIDGALKLKALKDSIAGHHENFDGSGYPFGWSLEKIPLEAQIVSLADAFSAMSAPRPYRGSVSPAEIRKTIAQESGRRWSPELVQVFLDHCGNA